MFNEIAIETHRLRKSYGSGPVLDGIDLSCRSGQRVRVVRSQRRGQDNDRADLGHPGDARRRVGAVSGHDVLAQRRAVRQRISLTGQYAALDAPLTGRENLEMIGRLLRLPAGAARTRATDLLVQFDLTDAADRRVETYSGGMRRRLDLAASLICQPEVVFLDEPTTGLDPRSRQAMWETVTDLTASGVTVFLTTQYLEEADSLGRPDRTARRGQDRR